MEPTSIGGAWTFTPALHRDERGYFLEWFQAGELSESLGYRPEIAQANCSMSRQGVVRGVHFASVPPGQAKYVTCVSGAVLDVIVDVRVGSPTYGRWEDVRLDDTSRRAVFLAEGWAEPAETPGKVAKSGRTKFNAASCISPTLRVSLEKTRFPTGTLPASKRMMNGGTVPGGMKARARFT